jgi:predicted amidohydrolase YtcJ
MPLTNYTVIGRILDPTMAGGAAKHGRIAVSEGRFVNPELAVGGTVLDFGERIVMPAFIDPHTHTEVSARALATMVDVRVPRCETVGDVLDVLRDAVPDCREAGTWLRAQANLFFNLKLRERRYPSRDELDSVSPDVPIAVHAGGHSTLLNSAAIDLADLGRFTGGKRGAMGGAVIEKDSFGNFSGVVSEIDSFLPIREGEMDLDEILREGASALYTKFGVSVIGDISGSFEGTRALAGLVASGGIRQRVEQFVCAPGTMEFEQALAAQSAIGHESSRFSVRGVKVFADGGFSSKNAATLTAYRSEHALRPGSKGRINLDQRIIASFISRTSEVGLQLAVHANGERAQASVMRAIGSLLNSDGPPIRVEHAGNLLTNFAAVATWRELGVQPMPQAVFLYNFGDFFADYLGRVAERGRFPFKSLIADGWRIPASSDTYIGAEEQQSNPFFGVWCAVARETFHGHVIEPEESVDVRTALLMHTLYPAEALGIDQTHGSLTQGKEADFIVVDRDPLTVPTCDLPNIKVEHLFIGGSSAFIREGAQPWASSQSRGPSER